MSVQDKSIGIYAGSLRPGGGLTVLNQIISALAHDGRRLVIYTGARDTAREVRELARQYKQVEVLEFMAGSPAFLRNLFSKFLFIANKRSRHFACLITFNYYLPANCPSLTYHINLLSFQKAARDTLGAWIKRLDAKLACLYADANIFESHYLLERAKARMGSKVKQPYVLYIGAHPDFYQPEMRTPVNADIMLVSSMQPHKDNQTCLDMLRILVKNRPDVPWRLVIAGGQSASQWDSLMLEARHMGIADNIEIAGRMDRTALSRRLNQSLCLVSASRIESFCMVAVESMASLCPAVVTNATSMPESVADAAVIVESGNPKQFADACIAFHDDEKLREHYIKAGAARAAQFTPGQFRENLLSLLRSNELEVTP